MAHYNCILIDLDNTLLDFDAAEDAAIRQTLAHFELPADDGTVETYRQINTALWQELERGALRREKLLTLRFTKLLRRLDRQGSPGKMNEYYISRLAQCAQPLPGALEFLADVEDYATLAVITNGNQRVQASRLMASGVGEYVDGVFISEKVGVAKPDKRFITLALERLGVANKKKVLVVGDSLSADIRCGIAAGVDTCWCNFRQLPADPKIPPTYTVRGFEELKTVILEQEELDHAGEKKKHQL